MSRYEYMKFLLRYFPLDIIGQYKIMDLLDKNGFVYLEIRKGMCGLN